MTDVPPADRCLVVIPTYDEATSIDRVRGVAARYAEVLTFLAVGGTGYVVDVGSFNFFRSLAPFANTDPAVARTLAVLVAMVVTYVGNRTFTWAGSSNQDRRRELGLFVLFNVIGFGFSVVTLVVSHDLLGLRGALADNLSANVLGVALGTVFRFVTYKRFVFAVEAPRSDSERIDTFDRSTSSESA